MKQRKILISGLGGSLFPYLHEQIKGKFHPVYVDSNPSLSKIYPDFDFHLAPLVRAPEYKKFIIDLIRKYQIDVYMPLIDEEIPIGHAVVQELPEVFYLSPDSTFSILCLDKYKLMKELERLKLSQIASWRGHDFKWGNHDTIFVKPIDGRGSRGIRKIKNPEELKAYYVLERYKPEEVLIQEYIEGTEYTVGLTTNSLDQILSITPKRVISKKGITIEAVVDNNEKIFSFCEKLNSALEPKGAINIQLFQTSSGELKVFEINPRFSTTSIMSFYSGLDEVSLLLDYWKKPYPTAPQRAKNGIRLIRRWENLFYES